MVRRLLLHRVGDVHRSCFRVLRGHDAERLRIEVVQGREFPLRPDDVRAAEQVARPRADFPVDDVVVRLRVAVHRDLADAELLAFVHPHFDVDGVVLDADFHRHGLEGQIAVVLVERAEVAALRVHEYPLFKSLQIIHFTRANAHEGVQLA